MRLKIVKNKSKVFLKKFFVLIKKGKSKFYSQDGQDEFIERVIFKDLYNGYFVDIGANDGITYSNSYYFEKKGWSGVCVEPIPCIFEKLKNNRKCVLFNGVISSNRKEYVDFLHVKGYAEMLSGIINNYENKHMDRVDKEIRDYGGKKQFIKVKNYHFDDVVKIKNIDYLTIDVEGSELDIIKMIDFNKYYIKVITVESPYENKEIQRHLEKNNFDLVKRIGSDDLYINKKINFMGLN